jgi:hypothetical protein
MKSTKTEVEPLEPRRAVAIVPKWVKRSAELQNA